MLTKPSTAGVSLASERQAGRKARRQSRRPGGAAPHPNRLHSLGYPATNNTRGKVQAGTLLLRHHLKTSSYTC